MVAQGGDFRRQHKFDRMMVDARKIEVKREPSFDRGEQMLADDNLRFSLMPLDLIRAGRPPHPAQARHRAQAASAHHSKAFTMSWHPSLASRGHNRRSSIVRAAQAALMIQLTFARRVAEGARPHGSKD